MWSAAKATYPQEWERIMKEIQKVNDDAYKDLLKIPPRFWSKSRFSFQPKCDILLNNMSKTFNSVILDAREKPIVTMLEEIRTYLMTRWADNRKKIHKYKESVLPNIKKRLGKEITKSTRWISTWLGQRNLRLLVIELISL